MKAKIRKPDQRYGVVAVKRSKTGNVVNTSQGPVVFDKDLVGVKNEEQMREVVESAPWYYKPVCGERPNAPGSKPMFVMPDMSHIFRKKNRMSVQEREEEERERIERGDFDQ